MIEGQARIKIFGVGGGGCNAVNRMIEEDVKDVEYYAVNTDAQALKQSKPQNKIAVGTLGAGSKPEIGRQAAEKHLDEIKNVVKDAEMVYITCGEGINRNYFYPLKAGQTIYVNNSYNYWRCFAAS